MAFAVTWAAGAMAEVLLLASVCAGLGTLVAEGRLDVDKVIPITDGSDLSAAQSQTQALTNAWRSLEEAATAVVTSRGRVMPANGNDFTTVSEGLD